MSGQKERAEGRSLCRTEDQEMAGQGNLSVADQRARDRDRDEILKGMVPALWVMGILTMALHPGWSHTYVAFMYLIPIIFTTLFRLRFDWEAKLRRNQVPGKDTHKAEFLLLFAFIIWTEGMSLAGSPAIWTAGVVTYSLVLATLKDLQFRKRLKELSSSRSVPTLGPPT